jgi:citrate synthase
MGAGRIGEVEHRSGERADGSAGGSTVTVIDNRTGERFELPIEDGAVRSSEFGRRAGGLALYDPGLSSTAVCRSAITYIDGEGGVLRHRGYRIEALCERSSFLELAYLLIKGELPTVGQYESWLREIGTRNFVHENVKGFIGGFRYDARPIAMVAASVGALSSFYPDADQVYDEEARERQVVRLLAKLPTLAAFAYRHLQGLPYVHPEDHLSYTGNLLSMMFRMSELRYTPDPVVERALDVLLMLHADHEQNASTTAMRAVGSTHVNPYAAVAAGVTALSGPMRGGAAQDVLRMLRGIGSPGEVPGFLARVKSAHERLLGFGHWVYKTYDPRARVLRRQLEQLYEHRRPDPLFAIADELERRVLGDGYFTSRRLYPNLDLYSGLTYQALGIAPPMFPVMFALARSAGWIAQWVEMVKDPEQTTFRPLQLYTGALDREYLNVDERG